MDTRKAKKIAAQYPNVELWFDRSQFRVWYISDPMCNAASVDFSSGSMREATSADMHVWLKDASKDFSDHNCVLNPTDVFRICAEQDIPCHYDCNTQRWHIADAIFARLDVIDWSEGDLDSKIAESHLGNGWTVDYSRGPKHPPLWTPPENQS